MTDHLCIAQSCRRARQAAQHNQPLPPAADCRPLLTPMAFAAGSWIKGAAKSAGIPVFTIKSASVSHLVRWVPGQGGPACLESHRGRVQRGAWVLGAGLHARRPAKKVQDQEQ